LQLQRPHELLPREYAGFDQHGPERPPAKLAHRRTLSDHFVCRIGPHSVSRRPDMRNHAVFESDRSVGEHERLIPAAGDDRCMIDAGLHVTGQRLHITGSRSVLLVGERIDDFE